VTTQASLFLVASRRTATCARISARISPEATRCVRSYLMPLTAEQILPRALRTIVRRLLSSGLLVLIAAAELRGQQAQLAIAPARPLPGALVRLSLTDAAATRDSVVAVAGTMAGEPLHFVVARSGVWRAIGAVPVDSGGEVVAHAIASRASGRADTLSVSVTPPPLPPPKEQLAVAERFGRPLDSATEARVARENERALAVGRRSHESPPRWTAPFQRPRASAISSGFGTGRTFNGQVTSRHLGVDFRGALGAPIRAANAGVVVLVDTFFLGGRVVYIDHGGGLTTGYLHLSRALVAVGDDVAQGQVIGLVGATGRVTGPHLHWTARYGALTVNPLDLLALGSMNGR
jgi:murein DD-endopeptidase MepM/ murein hydrolase activator NlpD